MSAKTWSTAPSTSAVERNETRRRTGSKRWPGAVAPALDAAPFLLEALGPGALEGIDRLLLVAHGKERAQSIACSFAGKEIVRECADDAPLAGARVLRLVDQDVIDALVQLVVHPGAGAVALQQIGGAADEIVEIETAAVALQPLVVAVEPGGERQRGARGLEDTQAREMIDASADMGQCRVDALGSIGHDAQADPSLRPRLESLRGSPLARQEQCS